MSNKVSITNNTNELILVEFINNDEEKAASLVVDRNSETTLDCYPHNLNTRHIVINPVIPKE